MDNQPTRTPTTLAIKVTIPAEKKIKQGHPWVFENSITKISKEGSIGDIAIVFDKKNNKFLAMGIYDPHSPIRIKILSTNKGDKPNVAFFTKKIKEAYNKRKQLIDVGVNGYRLLFGENDGLPSLICDYYNGHCVLKIYSAAWVPYLDYLSQAINECVDSKSILLRYSRSTSKTLGKSVSSYDIILGELTNPEITFKEYNVIFSAHLIKGHKTGFFLDHRHNRHKIQKMARGKSVLDVFAYAGGFSIHALVGGAAKATAVDISSQALALATKNAQLNNVENRLECLTGDAFEILQKLVSNNSRYDLVIIDPPSFANSQDKIEIALKQYQRLALLGTKLTAQGGILLLASCSSRISSPAFFEMTDKVMKSQKKRCILLEKTLHDIDHPITFPEGAYLKSVYYQL